jgi:hypothetical protein
MKEPAKSAGALDKSNRLLSLHIEVLIPLFSQDFDISKEMVQRAIGSPQHFD